MRSDKRTRAKVSISVRPDLLFELDRQIDGRTIRNRSQAFERAIEVGLGLNQVKKALILAGGQGRRLRPMTLELPKPLMPIQGKPIIEHQIEALRRSGVEEFIVAVSHLGERVKAVLGNGSRFGIKIEYFEERKPLGTAGSLRPLRTKLDQAFFMLAGDVLADINFSDLARFHLNHGSIGTIAVRSVKDTARFGVVVMSRDRIVDFVEKPVAGKERSNLINAGIWVFSPEVTKYVKAGATSMEREIFPVLARENQLRGYFFSDQWFAVDTLEVYQEAIESWNSQNLSLGQT